MATTPEQAVLQQDPGSIELLSYDAWGERRDPFTWESSIGQPGQWTDRGFTEHEHLEELGLIHMNGRVYSPDVGRFISADPYVQFPDSSQGLNRYSYVLNNPLSFTDPSGYFLGGEWIAAFIVATVINSIINTSTYYVEGALRESGNQSGTLEGTDQFFSSVRVSDEQQAGAGAGGRLERFHATAEERVFETIVTASAANTHHSPQVSEVSATTNAALSGMIAAPAGQAADDVTGFDSWQYDSTFNSSDGAFWTAISLVSGELLAVAVYKTVVKSIGKRVLDRLVPNSAHSSANAARLEKQLASEEQLGQLSSGGGTVISQPAKAADRVAAQTGRNPANIQKVSSDSRVARDGQHVETHAFRDATTNELIEPKTIIEP